MAGVRVGFVSAQISTGTSAKTLLQVVAATNQRVLITEASIDFEGVSNTATPIQVDFIIQSTAGTMSALTPVKLNQGDNETLQVTAQHTATAEPTTTAAIKRYLVHPQTGRGWQAPFDRPIIIIGGGRLGVTVTADASVDAVVYAEGEE